jgi:sterigmatocystin biosynthesis cytochrome P450 monooxygenase
MVQYLSKKLDARFKTRIGRSEITERDHGKTIIDLALSSYLAEKGQTPPSDTMDSTFQDIAICQIRTFAFAGHDTVSSTICYAFHLLSTHPTARRLLIEEHNNVLGLDYKQAGSLIDENPQLLGQLPYTVAILKETLRLYPPASSTRGGEPNHFIPGPEGCQLPTDGFLVWANSWSIHHDPSYWPEPNEFLPERWLVPEGDRLYPMKGVYRPFEFGPRHCIGQELAMLELKIILIMTTREFEIVTVYEEWDALHPSKGPKDVDGDRAYQVLSGSAHPCDGLPCRVSLAIA